MRTYDRATYLAAQAAWRNGDFGEEWEPYRHLAANAGYIFPPDGSRHDDRDAEHPSQRAVIWRAIEDAPAWLRRTVARSRSWSQVVAAIIANEGGLRDDARLAERAERELRPRYSAPTLTAQILEHMKGLER